MTVQELIAEIEAQRSLMILVATGGPRIQDVNEEYIERRSRISTALTSYGIDDPNPYTDLWRWYGKWSDGSLPSYQLRRQYVADLIDPLLETVRRYRLPIGSDIFEELTGWERVDRGLDNVKRKIHMASSEEEYQSIGLLCRETLISVAQAVYDPSLHTTEDGITPSDTDAKRMLEAFFSYELAGGSNEQARRHAKAALALANGLQHSRTATIRDAALCAEATASVVNIIAILSGRRYPLNNG